MDTRKNITTTVRIGRLAITSPAGRPAPDAFCIPKANAMTCVPCFGLVR